MDDNKKDPLDFDEDEPNLKRGFTSKLSKGASSKIAAKQSSKDISREESHDFKKNSKEELEKIKAKDFSKGSSGRDNFSKFNASENTKVKNFLDNNIIAVVLYDQIIFFSNTSVFF